MAIDLRTFASGDTDYIAKLNQNMAALKAAIDALQLQVQSAGPGSAISTGNFMSALFNLADCLIGPTAYKPALSASTATVAPGSMYLISTQTVVTWFAPVAISFAGQPAGTHYIAVDGAGQPTRVLTAPPGGGVAWSVNWSGGGFIGDPIRIANCFYDSAEATASRDSTVLNEDFDTLDERLEENETVADEAHRLASRFRKIGVTVTETGIAGQIQIDFWGTIVGWSAIGNDVGDLEVSVAVIGSSPPDEAPMIPDPIADKISASAPITITSAQSASEVAADLTGWNTVLAPWDVVQFNCVTLLGMTRATLYLLIREELVEPGAVEFSPPEPPPVSIPEPSPPE